MGVANCKLTKAEADVLAWAQEGQSSCLEDFEHEHPGFSNSEHLKREDILFRLEQMAPGMAEPDPDLTQFARAARRAARKLRCQWGIA